MRLLLPWTALLLSVGCAQGPGREDPDALGVSTSPIIGGELDTTHEAVVLVASDVGLCSGTIIKVDPVSHVGWVLTAAHCVDKPLAAVLQGPKYDDQAKVIRYAVLDQVGHPQYEGTRFTHDIGMVRILGVDASTPVIPIASASDGIAVRTPVLSVGYGRTTPANQPADSNTRRKRIAKSIGQLTTSLITYSLSGGGICSGDSGGPVLTTQGGEKVVGVHSFVSGDCLGDGSSTRVSSELAFINAQLAKPLPNLTSCKSCLDIQSSGTTECADAERTCVGDASCFALIKCYQACTRESCRTTCREKNPDAIGKLNKLVSCSCRVGCASECASDTTSCGAVPKCGITATEACGTCGEGACCAERLAASFDDVGALCVADSTTDGCADNAPFQAYNTCLKNNCSEPCGLTAAEPPPADAPTDGSGAAGADSTTSSGCHAGSTSSGGASMLVVLALVFAARRRRETHRESR